MQQEEDEEDDLGRLKRSSLSSSCSSSELHLSRRHLQQHLRRSTSSNSGELLVHAELAEKLDERRRSITNNEAASGEEDQQLQLMDRRQMRQFSRADEYLYAMKEDLAEWFNILYPRMDIDAENFMDKLETGEDLVKVRKGEKRDTTLSSRRFWTTSLVVVVVVVGGGYHPSFLPSPRSLFLLHMAIAGEGGIVEEEEKLLPKDR